jgi:hypothetical protein
MLEHVTLSLVASATDGTHGQLDNGTTTVHTLWCITCCPATGPKVHTSGTEPSTPWQRTVSLLLVAWGGMRVLKDKTK